MKERRTSLTSSLREAILFQRWYRRAPQEVQKRYQELLSDLQRLRMRGFIPVSPQTILDAYSGSGAGSMTLRQLYGKDPRIVAVDNASSHQSNAQYKVRIPPAWVAESVPTSIQTLEETVHPQFDLIMAARPALCHRNELPWTKRCENEVLNIIALAKMLTPDGTLLYGTFWDFRPRETDILRENFALSRLFSSVRGLDSQNSDRQEFNDDWISLTGVDRDFLTTVKQDHRKLLHEKGLWYRDPYEGSRG